MFTESVQDYQEFQESLALFHYFTLKIHNPFPQCKSQCRTNERKPGTCPKSDTPKWEAACVEACNSDSQCDGTQRCCRHGCGATCSDPTDLLTIPGITDWTRLLIVFRG